MRKPPYLSHYLVLKDLIDGIDVRRYSDINTYLTSRIENIKCDLVKYGIKFIEDVSEESRYSHYKPYILFPSFENIQRAKELLKIFGTDEVLAFIETKPNIDGVSHYENSRSNWLNEH